MPSARLIKDKLWVDGEPVLAAHGLVTFQVETAASSIFAARAEAASILQRFIGNIK
jgi:hypothetical protein